jgi:hypothetical protein
MSVRLARTSLLVAVLAGALLGGSAGAAPRATLTTPPRYDAAGTTRLYALVNAHRTAKGLRPLAVSTRLAPIARTWTTHMASTGTFAHNDAMFSAASHRALGMSTLGENVAYNYSVEAAHTALLNSPHHLYNIELPAFAVAGFAVVVDGTGKYWVTEDFGSAPRAAAAPAPVRVVAKRVAAPRPVVRAAVRPKAAPKPVVRAVPRPAPRPAATVAAKAAPRPAPEVLAPTTADAVPVATTPLAAHRSSGNAALPWSAAGLLAAVVVGFARLRA